MQHIVKKGINCILMIMMTLCLGACQARSSSVNMGNDLTEENIVYAEGFAISKVGTDAFIVQTRDQKVLFYPDDEKTYDEYTGDKTVVPVKQPQGDIYVAASSIPDMLDCLGQLDKMSYTSTSLNDWALDSVKSRIEDGRIEYIGKYRAPDYEYLLVNGCELAVESTMIYHSPEVKEKLEQLKIPVFVDYSSYESNPLGRMEWIKVYGAMLGCYDEACDIFDDIVNRVSSIEEYTGDKKVAFFYISGNGSVIVRKPGDYVTKMIEMAGGQYVIASMPDEDNALSTMNMQMEAFYKEAIDADILIYNSTIDGEIDTLEDLTGKSELLADFKAYKDGRVFCTGKNMFQETSCIAQMIEDLHKVIVFDDDEGLRYLHRLK